MALAAYNNYQIYPANTTFQDWVTITNQITDDMANTVITLGTDNVGDVALQGGLTANTFATDQISSIAGSVDFNSNTVFFGTVDLIDLDITGDVNLTGNTSLIVNNANTTINGSLLTVGSTNVKFSGVVDFAANTTFKDVAMVNLSVSGSMPSLTVNNDITVLGTANVEFVSANNTQTNSLQVLVDTTVENLDVNGVFTVPTVTDAGKPGTPAAGTFLYNTNLNQFEGYNGTKWIQLENFLPKLVTANYTISRKEHIIADTTAAAFTVTLPLSPAAGDYMRIAGEGWGTNNLTIDRNGSTINGVGSNLILDSSTVAIEFYYDGGTWETYEVYDQVHLEETVANENKFLTFLSDTSPDITKLEITSAKLFFNPSTGTLTATDYNSLSDITEKENITPIQNVDSVMANIQPVEFTWKENGMKSYGVIAQQLEEVLPELISANGTKKYVNYTPLIGILLQGYKDLLKRIEELENDK